MAPTLPEQIAVECDGQHQSVGEFAIHYWICSNYSSSCVLSYFVPIYWCLMCSFCWDQMQQCLVICIQEWCLPQQCHRWLHQLQVIDDIDVWTDWAVMTVLLLNLLLLHEVCNSHKTFVSCLLHVFSSVVVEILHYFPLLINHWYILCGRFLWFSSSRCNFPVNVVNKMCLYS